MTVSGSLKELHMSGMALCLPISLQGSRNREQSDRADKCCRLGMITASWNGGGHVSLLVLNSVTRETFVNDSEDPMYFLCGCSRVNEVQSNGIST